MTKGPIKDPLIIRLIEADNLIRELEDLSSLAVPVLFLVAGCGECTKTFLEQELDISVASGSRITDQLSTTSYVKDMKGKRIKGMCLIKKYRDPDDKRKIMLKLTKKGQEFMDAFKLVLWPDYGGS